MGHKELFKIILGKETEADSAMDEAQKAMGRAKGARKSSREAAQKLAEMYKGKSRDELSDIWESEFKEMTLEYYKSLPGANDLQTYRAKRKYDIQRPAWEGNYKSRRIWFLNRMVGNIKKQVVDAPFAKNNTIVKYLKTYTEECEKRIGDMTPQERKAIHESVLLKLANALHPYAAEIKNTKLVCWCGKKDTSYNGMDCSLECEKARNAYEAHRASA